MKDLTHIERANLPWREESATECGLDATRHPTWTREEVEAKEKKLGQQRLAMLACMTCLQTYRRHSTWDDDPASCMVRHAEKMTMSWGRRTQEKRKFADELRAIAMLIEDHRDEFDALVAGLEEVVDIREARRGRGR